MSSEANIMADPAIGSSVSRTCHAILSLLLPHRRGSDTANIIDKAAFVPQRRQLADFVSVGDPILFTLPAFPCKSPNPAKVLGHLPDEGERLSLRFLDRLCSRIEQLYAPGARMLICSDGHIFGDLIGVPDEHIDAYANELITMIRAENLSRIDTFSLRDVLGDLPYDEKRRQVHDRYAPTVEELRTRAQTDPDLVRLYVGITRFLVDDTTGFEGTKSALQRHCRQRAYGVIQRSQAWSSLITDHYPRSVRLSIHPQPVGSAKFGIRLLESANVWTTPWHSCVVRYPGDTWKLMPHHAAEEVGRLVTRNGRPSHFVHRDIHVSTVAETVPVSTPEL